MLYNTFSTTSNQPSHVWLALTVKISHSASVPGSVPHFEEIFVRGKKSPHLLSLQHITPQGQFIIFLFCTKFLNDGSGFRNTLQFYNAE